MVAWRDRGTGAHDRLGGIPLPLVGRGRGGGGVMGRQWREAD